MANENTKERKEAKRAWRSIDEWIRAAAVTRTLRHSRFGFLGNTYSAECWICTVILRLHVEVLEMCDLDSILKAVSDDQVKRKMDEVKLMFEIS